MRVVLEHRDPAGRTLLRAVRVEGAYLIDAPGIEPVRVLASGVVELPDGPPEAESPEGRFLRRHVEPLLGQLRGTPALHGSAARVAGRAAGFVGRSGQGKSTIVAALRRAGHPALADDCVALAPTPSGFELMPDPSPELRLRDPTAEALAVETELETTDATGAPRHLVPLEHRAPTPMGHLFVLDEATAPQVTPISRRDALLELARHVHRVDPTDPALLAAELAFLERVVRAVPVWRLAYPRRFEVISEVVALVEGTMAAR